MRAPWPPPCTCPLEILVANAPVRFVIYPEEFQLSVMPALEGPDGLANVTVDSLIFGDGGTYTEVELWIMTRT